MKKFANYIFIFTLAILSAVYPLKSASAQVGGYVGIWGGYTISPDASSGNFNDWYYGGYNNFDLDIQEAWAFGVKFGYTPPPLRYLSFEFEYSYLNPDINRSLLYQYGSGYVVDGDVKLNNFMFNVIAKYPLRRFHPYVGAGIGCTYSDVAATATQSSSGGGISSASAGKDYTSFAWQLLTGVEIDITNNLSADIGYRYFATEFEFNNLPYGNNTIDYTTSMITLGLKFLF
ncbi:MAG: outer membrane protein [Smithella sp.]